MNSEHQTPPSRPSAIVQQCNDHTDKRSLERSLCWTRLCRVCKMLESIIRKQIIKHMKNQIDKTFS